VFVVVLTELELLNDELVERVLLELELELSELEEDDEELEIEELVLIEVVVPSASVCMRNNASELGLV
jgi:hypothetical protein